MAEIVLAADLADHGLTTADLRDWPIPEYVDSDGSLYWRADDVISIMPLDGEGLQ